MIMHQDYKFCYSAPVIQIIEVSVGKSILDGSGQLPRATEDDYGDF